MRIDGVLIACYFSYIRHDDEFQAIYNKANRSLKKLPPTCISSEKFVSRPRVSVLLFERGTQTSRRRILILFSSMGLENSSYDYYLFDLYIVIDL